MNALTSPISNDSFAARFGAPLPRDLQKHAEGMSWTNFTQQFAASSGPIRLGSWDSTTARGGRTSFAATFGIGDSIHSASATTYGPIDALTSMLYDAGFHLEIISFHQQTVHSADPNSANPTAERGDRTATFVLAEFDGRQRWSMAIESGATESSIRAIIGAANMLHG
ncbi:2-isopropylmalate synthase [Rhodococcus sp. EPR-157]|jgi:chloramphenicol 3-O-phosphotransferase|uniref:2-isopropylmalate synthase n=1 Tax=Rhodococcus sp. EPR-157 TaxID=1813677 RepID=UPI0007BB8444|nr:2-isopropylmalate synthase [Rhodococcus sp. EPR-157]KZF10335.1 2-isopropylmalate synthase [Rhodococcus sp. EPR-157]